MFGVFSGPGATDEHADIAFSHAAASTPAGGPDSGPEADGIPCCVRQ
jgi:hypothetical protein